MKNYKNEVVCIHHKQPITKIDTVSKRLICRKCEEQSELEYSNRLEVMRAKLNASYSDELAKLNNLKLEVDQVAQVFITHNMVDAKRKIKKQLSTTQQLVDSIVNKEIQQANRQLKVFTERLLKPWSNMESRKFDFSFIEFEKAYPSLLEQVEEKKKQLREKISSKIKAELAIFYCKLFNL